MKNFKYYSKNIELPLNSLQIWGLSCQNEVMILEIFGFWHPNLSILVWSDLWLTGRCNAVPKVSLTDCKSHLPLWKKKKKKRKRVGMTGSKTFSECFVNAGEVQRLNIIPQCSKKCFLGAELVLTSPVWGCNCQGQCHGPAFEPWQEQWRAPIPAKPCCRNIPSFWGGRWSVPNPTAGVKRFWAQHKRLCNNNKSIHTEEP